MYVCICHAVTDKDIRAAAKNGACSLEALGVSLRVATSCGRCAECARSVLHETTQVTAGASDQAAAA